MPKKKLPRLTAAEEEGKRQLGEPAAKHPNLKDAQDLLAKQARPVNLRAQPVRGTGRSGPDTTF